MADIITCHQCEKVVKYDTFRDSFSLKEFFISGMCQECQDKTFNEKDFMIWINKLYDAYKKKEKK